MQYSIHEDNSISKKIKETLEAVMICPLEEVLKFLEGALT
jgi:hypothetical protein